MRDKDSQLIFESYKKRVLVNEQMAELSEIPILGLEAAITSIAGTGAALAVMHNLSKAYNDLTGQQEKIANQRIETIKTFIESEDASPRSLYNFLNFIKQNTYNKELLDIVNEVEQQLKSYTHLNDEMDIDEEILNGLMTEADATLEKLYNFAQSEIKIKLTGGAAIQASKAGGVNVKFGSEGGGPSGGGPSGGGPSGGGPSGGGKWKLGLGIAAGTGALLKKYWKILTGIGVVVLGGTNPEFLSDITKTAVESGLDTSGALIKGTAEGIGNATGLSKPSTSPTFQSGKIPIGTYNPNAKQFEAKASPTPYETKNPNL